ncbi:MAG: phosphate/phosphite/phosphonate ABC transporter substrate-binding protein [Bdellovibrionota bacterium]
MKQLLRFRIFLFLSVFLSSALFANPDILIGLTPNEAVPKVKELEAELAKRLGEKVVLFVAPNYEELSVAFQKGAVQFAILPPRLAIKLEAKTPLRYLLKKVYGESEYYYSAIATLSNSSIKNLKALKGKKVGFVDLESGSGYLYPRQMLRQAGLPDGSYTESFHVTHEKALEALVKGEVDAVGVWADEPSTKEGAWTKFSENMPKKVKFRALAYSEPIPNDPLIVREDFHKAQPSKVLRLMEVLLALSEESSLIKDVTGADRLTTATRMHFESVRQLESKAAPNTPSKKK